MATYGTAEYAIEKLEAAIAAVRSGDLEEAHTKTALAEATLFNLAYPRKVA